MTIKIYKPSKTSMQSGYKKTKLWLAEYISDVEKVKDSLMGWNSSLDTKSQIKLFFETKEQAIDWAKKVQDLGAGEIMLTSVDMEGTKKGFDIDKPRNLAKSVTVE